MARLAAATRVFALLFALCRAAENIEDAASDCPEAAEEAFAMELVQMPSGSTLGKTPTADAEEPGEEDGAVLRQAASLRGTSPLALVQTVGLADYGQSSCPCIGIDWNGNLSLTVGGVAASYPAALGSSCMNWDAGNHPSCLGRHRPSWCRDRWCYVDPCNCAMSPPPKVSHRAPAATFQGHQVYYSYATCSSTDRFTASENPDACENQLNETGCGNHTKCAWTPGQGCLGKEIARGCATPPSTRRYGNSTCQCIGISGQPGDVIANIAGGLYLYPSDVGSSCSAWDLRRSPQCANTSGTARPSWCEHQWCYVDPCSCFLDDLPVKQNYFVGAKFQGRPLFYSYETCGADDKYTSSENAFACQNFKTAYRCGSVLGCTWTKSKGCVSDKFASLCGWNVDAPGPAPPPAPKPSAARSLAPGAALLAGLGLLAVQGGLQTS